MTLYYESHVTIDPVFDARRKVAILCAAYYGFRLAKLIMRKDYADAETESTDDTFMTAVAYDLSDIQYRTRGLVEMLLRNQFVVRRYKIEDAIMDSRVADELDLLGK